MLSCCTVKYHGDAFQLIFLGRNNGLVLFHGNCDAPGYYLKDVNLDNVDYHKDLGVIVDNHCLFKQHVSYICKKAYCSTNVLFRCFHTANTAALIRGYKSYIRPVLEYCSPV